MVKTKMIAELEHNLKKFDVAAGKTSVVDQHFISNYLQFHTP